MIKEKICPDCKENKCKFLGKGKLSRQPYFSETCILCHNKRRKEKQRIYLKKKNGSREKKVKLCEKCKKEFLPFKCTQRFCNNPCSHKRTEKEIFLNKKEHVCNLTSNQVAYGFFRKKHSPSKQFKACRG